jgi:hypothetical protein
MGSKMKITLMRIAANADFHSRKKHEFLSTTTIMPMNSTYPYYPLP